MANRYTRFFETKPRQRNSPPNPNAPHAALPPTHSPAKRCPGFLAKRGFASWVPARNRGRPDLLPGSRGGTGWNPIRPGAPKNGALPNGCAAPPEQTGAFHVEHWRNGRNATTPQQIAKKLTFLRYDHPPDRRNPPLRALSGVLTLFRSHSHPNLSHLGHNLLPFSLARLPTPA